MAEDEAEQRANERWHEVFQIASDPARTLNFQVPLAMPENLVQEGV
jgi:hypothetical protein